LLSENRRLAALHRFQRITELAMGIALEETDTGSLLRLDGAIDIASAAELKTLLVQALGPGRAVRVSIEAVTYMDVTAVQLFWAAERKARQAGTAFGVSDEVPGALSTALAEAGFSAFPTLVPAG
jgi:anti-anti-sigma factor